MKDFDKLLDIEFKEMSYNRLDTTCTLYYSVPTHNGDDIIIHDVGYFYVYDDSVAFISSYLGMIQSIVRLVLISGLEHTIVGIHLMVYLSSMKDFDKFFNLVNMVREYKIRNKERVEEFFNV